MQKRLSIQVVLFCLLSIFLLGADDVKLMRFEVVNRSGMEIAISLFGGKSEEMYYLPVAEGTREAPTSKTFAIVPDFYQMRVYYIETWDPVYGFKCGQQMPIPFSILRNSRLTVIECDRNPNRKGEPPAIRKYPLAPRLLYKFLYLMQ